MNADFEILEVLWQRDGEVIYRAETPLQEVAVFRYCPLHGDESLLGPRWQIYYTSAIQFLLQLRHPHIRSVIDGGLDQVDRMPWMVTESLPGETLSEAGRLSELDVRLLAAQGMAAMETIPADRAFLDWDAEKVVLSRDQTGLAFFTFVASLRLMLEEGAADPVRSLGLLVRGAIDRDISPELYGGLGAWVERAIAGGWSIAGAKAGLAEINSAKEEVIATRGRLVVPPSAPVAVQPVRRKSHPGLKKRGTGGGLVLFLVLTTVGVVGGGLYILDERARKTKEGEVVPEISDSSSAPEFPEKMIASPRRVVEEWPAESPPEGVAAAAVGGFADNPIVKRGAAVAVDADTLSGAEMAQLDGRWLVVTGTVDHARKTKATRYLEFTRDEGKGTAFVAIKLKELESPEDFPMEELRTMAGQQIRVLGQLTVAKRSGRCRIDISSPSQLELLSE